MVTTKIVVHFTTNHKILWSIISEFCPLGFWYVNALQQKAEENPRKTEVFRGEKRTFLALRELGRTTGGFEAVLNISMVRFSLILRAFSHFLLSVVLFLNHGNQ